MILMLIINILLRSVSWLFTITIGIWMIIEGWSFLINSIALLNSFTKILCFLGIQSTITWRLKVVWDELHIVNLTLAYDLHVSERIACFSSIMNATWDELLVWNVITLYWLLALRILICYLISVFKLALNMGAIFDEITCTTFLTEK